METNAQFLERLHQSERDFERKLNRDMLPIMLPSVMATGVLLGVLASMFLLPPLPREFIGVVMLAAMAVGVGPFVYLTIRYH